MASGSNYLVKVVAITSTLWKILMTLNYDGWPFSTKLHPQCEDDNDFKDNDDDDNYLGLDDVKYDDLNHDDVNYGNLEGRAQGGSSFSCLQRRPSDP